MYAFIVIKYSESWITQLTLETKCLQPKVWNPTTVQVQRPLLVESSAKHLPVDPIDKFVKQKTKNNIQ